MEFTKYAISIGDNGFVREVAWFTETLPVITLYTDSIETAQLFDGKSLEDIFHKHYHNVEFKPVYFKLD